MLSVCKTHNEDIFSKFIKDEEGNYYNERLEYEANKRKAYSESRRNNRKKKEEKETYEDDVKNICNSYEKHMENENANENINKNNKKVNDSCVNDLQDIIEFYNENIGLITPYGLEVLSSYIEDMDKELIILAMKKSVEANKRTIQYIKAILNNWSKKGIKTVLDAEQEDKKFRKKDSQMAEQREYESLDFLYQNLN